MARATLLIVLSLALAAPGAALADGSTQPVAPSNPVANQYAEMVPGPGGNTPSGSIRPRTGSKSPLPARVVRKLESAGNAGKAAASIDAALAQTSQRQTSSTTTGPAKATSPTSSNQTGAGNGSGRQRAAAKPTSAATAQVIKTLTGSTGGGGGLGLLLPVILVVSLVAASLAGVLRRRGAA